MGKVFAFHGGIHPPENKKQSTRAGVSRAPIPERLVIPVQQHIGGAADPIVAPGDRVLKGQMIAEPIGRISAAIHAPTSGTIIDISQQPIPHASGLNGECIIIETDGKDEWIEHHGFSDYKSVAPEDLVAHIRRSGVAGMGGAGFPTDVKLHLGDNHIVNTLIINAAECEPYITADDMLMRERADEVIGGIEVIAHLLKPSHVMIGIEDNKPNAIDALHIALKKSSLNIDIVVVPTKYPSGGEKQLIKLLTNIEIPSGRIPADVGIVCQNVGTTAAIYRAVHFGEPLISRFVTVTGDAVEHPQNFETLIGTPFSTLLKAADVRRDALSQLVMGGPMMGVTVTHDEIPVIKTTNCIIAATQQEMPPAPPSQACIRCGMCEQACPANLLPQQLYWFSKGNEFDKAKNHNLFDCIECGACAYVCPSSIPLVQYYRYAKSEIRQEEAEQRKSDHARARFEARQARIEREAAEKEARRKARAEEAALAQQQRQKAAESAAAAPAPSAADLKKLKTDAAVARTKLKKAQKAYDDALATNADDAQALLAALNEAKAKSEAAQQALEQAESGTGTQQPSVDTKQLKTAAAVARTKLKKAQKALDTAKENGEETAELEAALKEAQSKADEAQKALENAESGNATTSAQPAVDIKQLKTAAAVARTKLKKAQKALDTAKENGEETAELEAALKEAQSKADAAQQAFESAENGSAAPAAQPAVDIKQLKTAAAVARTKLKKAQKALDTAKENGEETAELEAALKEAQSKADAAQQAFESAENGTAAPAAESTVDLKQLKTAAAVARTKLKKAQDALKDAQSKGLDGIDKLEETVSTLQQKADQAQKALDDAQGSSNATAAPAAVEPAPEPVVDMKTLKQQVSIQRTKLKKLESRYESADDAEKATLEAELETVRSRFAEASATLARAENAKAEEAASQGVDLKQLKIDAAMARAAVTKAERVLQKAETDSEREPLAAQLEEARKTAAELDEKLKRFE